jgi:hypothetical protein
MMSILHLLNIFIIIIIIVILFIYDTGGIYDPNQSWYDDDDVLIPLGGGNIITTTTTFVVWIDATVVYTPEKYIHIRLLRSAIPDPQLYIYDVYIYM